MTRPTRDQYALVDRRIQHVIFVPAESYEEFITYMDGELTKFDEEKKHIGNPWGLPCPICSESLYECNCEIEIAKCGDCGEDMDECQCSYDGEITPEELEELLGMPLDQFEEEYIDDIVEDLDDLEEDW